MPVFKYEVDGKTYGYEAETEDDALEALDMDLGPVSTAPQGVSLAAHTQPTPETTLRVGPEAPDYERTGSMSEPSTFRRFFGPLARAVYAPEGEAVEKPLQVPLTLLSRMERTATEAGGELASGLAEKAPGLPAGIPATAGLVAALGLDPSMYLAPGASKVAPRLASAPEAALRLPAGLERLLTPKEGAFYHQFDPRAVGEQAQALAAAGRAVGKIPGAIKAGLESRRVAQAGEALTEAEALAGELPHVGLTTEAQSPAQRLKSELFGTLSEVPESVRGPQREVVEAAAQRRAEFARAGEIPPEVNEALALEGTAPTALEQPSAEALQQALKGDLPPELVETVRAAEQAGEPMPSILPKEGAAVLDTNPVAAQEVGAQARSRLERIRDFIYKPREEFFGPAFRGEMALSNAERQLAAQGLKKGDSPNFLDYLLGPSMASPERFRIAEATLNARSESIDKYTQVLKRVSQAVQSSKVIATATPEVQALKRAVQGLPADAKVWVTNGDLVAFALNGSIKVSDLPAELQRSVAVLRGVLDDLARMEGVKASPVYMADYFPHVVDDPALVRQLMAKKGAGQMTPEGFVVTDPFLKKRLRNQGWSLDWQKAIGARVWAAHKTEYMEPFAKWMTVKNQALPDTVGGKFADWYFNKWTEKLLSRPGNVEQGLDTLAAKMTPEFVYRWLEKANKADVIRWGKDTGWLKTLPSEYLPGPGWSGAGARFVANAMYNYLLMGSLSTAVKNTLQGVNTIGRIGLGRTAQGYMSLLTADGRKAFSESKVMQDMENIFDGYSEALSRKGFLRKLERTGMLPMKGAEWLNRGAAYNGGLLEAAQLAKRGLIANTKASLHEYALSIVRDTQFTYGPVNTAPFLQNPVGRVIKVLGTYPALQTAFYKRLATASNDTKILGINAGLWRTLLTQGLVAGGALGIGADISETLGASNVEVGGTTIPVPLAGTVGQLKEFYGARPGPGVQLIKTLTGQETPKGAARQSALQIGLGAARVPGRAVGQGLDLFRELEKGYAQTQPQEAFPEALGIPGGKDRKRAYSLTKPQAVGKFFGLRPEPQQKYLKKQEEKRKKRNK